MHLKTSYSGSLQWWQRWKFWNLSLDCFYKRTSTLLLITFSAAARAAAALNAWTSLIQSLCKGCDTSLFFPWRERLEVFQRWIKGQGEDFMPRSNPTSPSRLSGQSKFHRISHILLVPTRCVNMPHLPQYRRVLSEAPGVHRFTAQPWPGGWPTSPWRICEKKTPVWPQRSVSGSRSMDLESWNVFYLQKVGRFFSQSWQSVCKAASFFEVNHSRRDYRAGEFWTRSSATFSSFALTAEQSDANVCERDLFWQQHGYILDFAISPGNSLVNVWFQRTDKEIA